MLQQKLLSSLFCDYFFFNFLIFDCFFFREPPQEETLQRSKTDTSIRSQSAPLEGAGIIGGEQLNIANVSSSSSKHFSYKLDHYYLPTSSCSLGNLSCHIHQTFKIASLSLYDACHREMWLPNGQLIGLQINWFVLARVITGVINIQCSLKIKISFFQVCRSLGVKRPGNRNSIRKNFNNKCKNRLISRKGTQEIIKCYIHV